jgi:hypothetical protein
VTSIRSELAAAGLIAVAAALSGCGGDDDKPSDTVDRVYRVPTTGQTTPEDVPVDPAPSTPSTAPEEPPPPTSPSPEDSPGGGGDEEPARTELTFTASSSGIKPRQAGVAPYISVKVTLRSADRTAHKLEIAGKTLEVGGTRVSSFVTLPGLRPGDSYRGVADGSTRVRILSTAEPGP